MSSDRSTSGSRSTAPVWADVVWILLALPIVALAVGAFLGIGWERGGADSVVGVMALAWVLLPPLGATLSWPGGRRLAMLGLSLAAWSTVLLTVFPLYFPGERAESIDAGTAAMVRALGVSLPPLGTWLDPRFPAVEGRPPAPDAVPARAPEASPPPLAVVSAPPPVQSAAPTPDEVILPYEGSGASLVVPVGLEHDGDELDVSMLFDTGASFTSVDSATLRALGIRVPRDAPEVVVRTANGERATKLVLLDTLWLGGFGVDGVTVGLCDACAHDDQVGLLGLNVSGRFLVTVDQQTRELRLRPRENPDRTPDVRYWVHPAARATAWPDGRVDVEVTLRNDAPRTVRNAVVRIGCDDGYDVQLPDVEAGGTAESRVSLPGGAECEGYTVELLSAGW